MDREYELALQMLESEPCRCPICVSSDPVAAYYDAGSEPEEHRGDR